ncbi:hypothetical protein [Blastochloris sulfoviridis]|uniref:Uncharacterized protein n=1 Tax=Blastochloris sulfoviridis TaxID=50712 RepID=A0A5M6I442_9HYPH|nr:hypothetical protein [Blastochloris sulfoviridis]KAA5602981.1 hypothetical protein F1193_03880 [Blastochloris sulfoviridis]
MNPYLVRIAQGLAIAAITFAFVGLSGRTDQTYVAAALMIAVLLTALVTRGIRWLLARSSRSPQ